MPPDRTFPGGGLPIPSPDAAEEMSRKSKIVHLDLEEERKWGKQETADLYSEIIEGDDSPEDIAEVKEAQKTAFLREIVARGADSALLEIVAHKRGFDSAKQAFEKFGVTEHGELVYGHKVNVEEEDLSFWQKKLGKGFSDRRKADFKKSAITGALSIAGVTALTVLTGGSALIAMGAATAATGGGIVGGNLLRAVADKFMREDKLYKGENGEYKGSLAHGSAEELVKFCVDAQKFGEISLRNLEESGLDLSITQKQEFRLRVMDTILHAAETGQSLSFDPEEKVKNIFGQGEMFAKGEMKAKLVETIAGVSGGIAGGIAGATGFKHLFSGLIELEAGRKLNEEGIRMIGDKISPDQNVGHMVKMFDGQAHYQLQASDIRGLPTDPSAYTGTNSFNYHGVIDQSSASPENLKEFANFLINNDSVNSAQYAGSTPEQVLKILTSTDTSLTYNLKISPDALKEAFRLGIDVYHIAPHAPGLPVAEYSSQALLGAYSALIGMQQAGIVGIEVVQSLKEKLDKSKNKKIAEKIIVALQTNTPESIKEIYEDLQAENKRLADEAEAAAEAAAASGAGAPPPSGGGSGPSGRPPTPEELIRLENERKRVETLASMKSYEDNLANPVVIKGIKDRTVDWSPNDQVVDVFLFEGLPSDMGDFKDQVKSFVHQKRDGIDPASRNPISVLYAIEEVDLEAWTGEHDSIKAAQIVADEIWSITGDDRPDAVQIIPTKDESVLKSTKKYVEDCNALKHLNGGRPFNFETPDITTF